MGFWNRQRLAIASSVALIAVFLAGYFLAFRSPAPHGPLSLTPSRSPSSPGAQATNAKTSTPVATPGSTPTPPGAPSVRTGFITRVGTRLFLNGQPYHFLGFNIYNANSRAGSTCWYTLNDGSGLDRALTDASGENAFRADFYQGLAMRNGVRDWSAFDKTLAVAAAHHMKVVASLSGEGGSCKDYPVDTHKLESWYQSGYTHPEATGESYRNWVRDVVSRYKDNPAILMWQMMGEAEDPVQWSPKVCSATANGTLKAWASDMAAMMKSIDRNHLVTVGTIGSGQCGASGSAYVGLYSSPNIDVCDREDYGHPSQAMPGDQWNGMLVRIQECAAMNKPLFVAETGIQRSDPNRRAEWDAKFAAQLGAGVVGEFIWDFSLGSISDGYEVLPGDPPMTLLAKYQ